MKNFFINIKNNILKKKSTQIFLITSIIHIGMVALFALVDFPLFANVADHVFYHESGVKIAELIRNGAYQFGDVYPHHWFPLFIGSLYLIFGANMIVGSLVNAFLIAGAAVLFYQILREYEVAERVAFFGSLIVLNGYASLIYHSSILLKESWIVFLTMAGIYLTMRIVKGYGDRKWLFGVLLIVFTLLRSLRFFIGFAVIISFFIDWFLNTHEKFFKKIRKGIVMIIVVCGLTFFLQAVPVIGGMPLVDMFDLDLLHKVHKDSSVNGSTSTHTQIIKPIVATKTSTMPVETDSLVAQKYAFSPGGLIKSILTTVVGPFPWQISLAKYAILLVDTLFVVGVFVLSLVGILKSNHERFWKLVPVVMVSGMIFFGIALGTDNIGAMVRQRIPAVVTLAIVAVIGLDLIVKKYVFKSQYSGK